MDARATYRVQLHAGFSFDDAAAVVPYLARLGVSHLYCSPYLQAAKGSTHGYDVVDHHAVNVEIGGEPAHRRLCAALRAAGLGHVVDIVPNHMAIARENAWWWDVLENGPSSQYASYFDIDWDPPQRWLTTKVLVPILGDHYGRVLEAGELRLERIEGAFTVRYHDHELPVSPRTLDALLGAAAERAGSAELAHLADAFGQLPHALATDRASVTERHRDKEVLRERLASLLDREPLAAAVDAETAAVNGDADRLDELLQRQNYRLAFWRTAGRELDYRRFFDITSLVALRVEDPEVFDATHGLVLSLVRRGDVDGLRIDHVDGLRDPLGYLQRLAGEVRPRAFVVVEKILEGDERLPASWPVAGTSGYDFLAQAGALLVDPAGEDALTAAYERFAGEAGPFASLARTAKHEIMRSVLATDVERLTEQFVLVADSDRRHRDYTRSELRDALRETIADFGTYRTYVRPGEDPSREDVDQVERATAAASHRRPDLGPELFAFLASVLLLRAGGDAGAELASRFQQVSSPVMAKAVEDTAFYRYHRLVALNEVGGDPGRFGSNVEAFHRARGAAASARSLLASSTHDTKRSEDVRARLACIAEIPDAWEEAVWRWAHDNERHRDAGLPDRNAEYLLYQSAVGAWPLPAERGVAYMEKAAKEAKVHTSWVDPDEAYDRALRCFTLGVLDDPAFRSSVEAFLAETGLVAAGRANSLAQTVLKLTCPGVPDIYQGCELWDLSLVDPDNRRPVDFHLRQQVLARAERLAAADVAALLGDPADPGTPKMWVIRRLLALRAADPALFDAAAGYEPLPVAGADAARVVAFSRADGRLVTIVTLRPLRGPIDATTSVFLPSGRAVGVATLTTPGLPVAVLVDAEPLW